MNTFYPWRGSTLLVEENILELPKIDKEGD